MPIAIVLPITLANIRRKSFALPIKVKDESLMPAVGAKLLPA